MTLVSATLLALLPLAAPQRPPLAVTVAAERLPLAVPADAVRLEASPFERRVTLHVRPGAAEPLARKLRDESRICPVVEVRPGAVSLACRTSRVRASLEIGPRQVMLDLRELSILPWRPGEEGPPLVPFDTETLGLGACPGETPLARGECALQGAELEGARRAFEEALRGGPSPLASLRLGDLALAADEPEIALEHWRRARPEAPWGRLAAARICELDAECLASEQRDAVFDSSAVALPLRADMTLRRARLRAFRGELVDAARALSEEVRPGGACVAAPAFCRHVLAVALALPPPQGTVALGVYVDTPGHADGPGALALARLAAAQAEAAGAPVYAANLLASLSGRVPDAELGPHLLRTARLFLAGGDRARAEEIVRFAQTRLPPAALRAPGWASAARAVRPARAARRPSPPPAADDALAAARAAVEAARLASMQKGASR